VRDLLATYRREPALHQLDHEPGGFEWIDCSDNENSVLSLLRRARDPRDYVIMVVNFTPVPRLNYRIGVPEGGVYYELLNSDAAVYGGSNVGNAGVIHADPEPAHNRPMSLCLTIPPLGCLLLKPSR
jgi:1,4-alpha-glucan branching enzyme